MLHGCKSLDKVGYGLDFHLDPTLTGIRADVGRQHDVFQLSQGAGVRLALEDVDRSAGQVTVRKGGKQRRLIDDTAP